MPTSILSEYEVQLLQGIVEFGLSRVTPRNMQELNELSGCFAERCFDQSYWQIRKFLYFGEYNRISNDDIKLFAMELLRLNADA